MTENSVLIASMDWTILLSITKLPKEVTEIAWLLLEVVS
jgi:hypothetical protein